MVIRQSTGISSALASFAFWSMQTLDGSCFLAYRDAGIGLLARLDEKELILSTDILKESWTTDIDLGTSRSSWVSRELREYYYHKRWA